MDQDERERRKFLEEQLEWCKEKNIILDEIDNVLKQMKAIAEDVLQSEFAPDEIEESNRQLTKLKLRINFLEQQLYVEVVN
ncbi:hypothetical protein [Solibacillus sp. FSL H8-0538]|uniref:hypothetical protein n=1 Tax=Solibacillus sp. FSL H8-0538 TaxID=2921400 RepID=UPI0030FA346A